MESSPTANKPDPLKRHYSVGRIVVAAVSGPAVLLGASFALGLVLYYVIQVYPALQLETINGEGERVFNVVVSGLVYALSLAAMLVFLRRYLFTERAAVPAVLGLHERPKSRDVGLSLIAFAGYFLTTVVVIALLSLIPGFNVDQPQEIGQEQPQFLWAYVVAFVGLVVFPPVFEELIFRGFMFGALRRQAGFWLSAIITSVAFGLVHGQPNVAADTFVLSMFLCAVRERTGAIWAPIILHTLKNGLAFTYLFVLGAQ